MMLKKFSLSGLKKSSADKKNPEVAAPAAAKIDWQKIADDFRYMNPNDPGAWPLIPRLTVLLALFVTAVVLIWWFVWNDQFADLESKRQQEETLKTEFLDKKRQAVNLDLYKRQSEEIDRAFGSLLKQLPSKSEIESLLIEVNQAGLGRGLQFELFRPAQEQMKDFYAELPIAVKINGTYHDLGAFAADIAKLPRIVTLNNMNLQPTKEGGSLTMDATTKTFRYLDEEEINQQRQAQRKAKKGGKK